jgi:hypothetical protein
MKAFVAIGNFTDGADTVEGLMFTASMSNAEKNEAYGRLNATATGKGPAQKEVKLCYVTVRPAIVTFLDSVEV